MWEIHPRIKVSNFEVGLHIAHPHHLLTVEINPPPPPPFSFRRNRTTGSLVTRSRSLADLEHRCPNHGSGIIHYFEYKYLQKGLQTQKEAGSTPPEPKNILDIWGRPGSLQARAAILTLPTTMHFYDLEPPLGEDRADRIRWSVVSVTACFGPIANGWGWWVGTMVGTGGVECV